MRKHTRPLFAAVMVAVIATAALAGAMSAPTVAQSDDDSVVDTLFGDSSEDDGLDLETVRAAVSGLIQRNNPFADRPEKADATEYAENTRSTFNQNSPTLRNWTNERATASTEYDTFRVKFTDESGNSQWLFLVMDVNTSTGDYTSATAMNLTEFKSTDRSVDKTYRLSPYASRNADEELTLFISEYAEPGKDLNRSYLARLAGEYRSDVSGDDLPGDN